MNQTMELYQIRCKQLKKDGLANEELNNYENFKDIFSEEEFKSIINEKKKRANKRNRVKNWIKEIYKSKELIEEESNVVFVTITLDDKNINLKENTYIRRIHSWIKEHFYIAILNKDFGDKTEREHYHFIGLTTEQMEYTGKKSKKGYDIYELINKTYKMGFEPTICKLDLKTHDLEQTTNYLLKLNNHSNKITTRNRVRIIKNEKYDMLCMLTGKSPSKAEKSIKNWMREMV